MAVLATVSALVLLSFCSHANAADKVTLSVSSPKAGATVSGAIKFTAAAKLTGAAKVVSVAFYVDGAYFGSDRTAPYTSKSSGAIDTKNLANGAHVFKAVATVKGKTAKVTTAATATVNNPTAAAPPAAPTPVPAPPPATTSEPTSPVVTPPGPAVPPAPSPLGAAGNWALKFADDFTDATASLSKWNTQRNDWLSGGIPYNSLEGSWYRTENVGVSDGNLSITVTDQSGNGYAQSSGMVNTRGKFDFKYGFIEARIRVPKCVGCWPAFWTLPATDTWPPEIDIFEFPQSSEAVTYPYFSYHWPDSTDPSGQQFESNVYFNGNNYDYTDSWHTYGLYWGPDKLQVYLDGLPGPATTNPTHIPAAAMYPILQLATGAQFRVPAGSTMLTDYVRVWQTG